CRDCISVTLGELLISHNFSLLGGRKNRDYDGSPFYFLVLHLVYESKMYDITIPETDYIDIDISRENEKNIRSERIYIN
ncbi:MAG: hypothetical protein ACRCTB_09020, partial [Vibrio sp.]